MNRYEFEDLISDYLEGKMTFKKIKEFEKFLENNEESRTLVDNIRNSISDLNRLDKIVVSTRFNEELLSKLKNKKPININDDKKFYGFSPRDAAMFSTLCLAIIFFSYSLLDFENDFSTSLSESTNIIDEKRQYFKSPKLRKGDNNFASDASLDSLKKSDKKYKANKNNKIKFVNN
ncbi:MAG: hypothetical protein ACJZ11_03060 [Candidatus Neomarinimicrobiota bacterium]